MSKTHEQWIAWQPIETAPKDGTPFIAANTFDACRAFYDIKGEAWTCEGEGKWFGQLTCPPTHWMPLPSADTNGSRDAIDQKTRGLYRKFNVTRTDGKDLDGGKHDGCDYFVLDLTHDPFALKPLEAYARACRKTYPKLASDLREKIAKMKALRGPFFTGKGAQE